MKTKIVKLLPIIVLALIVIGVITGCQSQVTPEISCSIEVISPGYHEALDGGNGTYEIKWIFTGPSNKKGDIILVGYSQEDEKIGEMLIDSNVPLSNESYTWGPNLLNPILQYFGTGENWPWWFEIEIQAENCSCSAEFFSIYW